MKYCSNCGNELNNDQDVCLKCGKSVNMSNNGQKTNANDTGSFGWGLLGFCIPIVGLILFLVWNDSQPLNAKSAGKGALISVVLYVLLYVFIIAGLIGSM